MRVRLPGRIDTQVGPAQSVEVLDLSSSGAQIACSYLAAGRIIPRERSMVDAVGFALRLTIGFDGREPAEDDDAIGAVVAYSRRMSQDDYRFGLRFGAIPAALSARLMACLEHARPED